METSAFMSPPFSLNPVVHPRKAFLQLALLALLKLSLSLISVGRCWTNTAGIKLGVQTGTNPEPSDITGEINNTKAGHEYLPAGGFSR